MSFSPDSIANFFLDLSDADKSLMTPMKLQKLMYFAHGWHLALEKDGKPLVSEPLEAWAYGPVFPRVYREFKKFGNRPITQRAVDSDMATGGSIVIIKPSVDDEGVRDDTLDVAFAKAVMDRVWAVYGKHSATKLSDMTHEKGSPWSTVVEKAKDQFQGRVPQGLDIPNEMIREWFKNRFHLAAASKAIA